MMSIICQLWKITSKVSTGAKHQNYNLLNVSIHFLTVSLWKRKYVYNFFCDWTKWFFWNVLQIKHKIIGRIKDILISFSQQTINQFTFLPKLFSCGEILKVFSICATLFGWSKVCFYLNDCKLFSECFVRMSSQYTENDQYYFHKWNLFYLLSQPDSLNPKDKNKT